MKRKNDEQSTALIKKTKYETEDELQPGKRTWRILVSGGEEYVKIANKLTNVIVVPDISYEFDLLWNPTKKRSDKTLSAMFRNAKIIQHPNLKNTLCANIISVSPSGEEIIVPKNPVLKETFIKLKYVDRYRESLKANWNEVKSLMDQMAFVVNLNEVETISIILIGQSVGNMNLGLLDVKYEASQFKNPYILICKEFCRIFDGAAFRSDGTGFTDEERRTLKKKKEVVQICNMKQWMLAVIDFGEETTFVTTWNTKVHIPAGESDLLELVPVEIIEGGMSINDGTTNSTPLEPLDTASIDKEVHSKKDGKRVQISEEIHEHIIEIPQIEFCYYEQCCRCGRTAIFKIDLMPRITDVCNMCRYKESCMLLTLAKTTRYADEIAKRKTEIRLIDKKIE